MDGGDEYSRIGVSLWGALGWALRGSGGGGVGDGCVT